MGLSGTRCFGLAIYFIAVLLPTGVSFWSVGQQGEGEEFLSKAARWSGVMSLSIFSLQFVLSAQWPMITKSLGTSTTLQLHRRMAVVASLLVGCHLSLMAWGLGKWHLLTQPIVGWPIQLGRLLVVVLLAMLAFSLCRNRIPIHNADWRWFHSAFAWTILVGSVVHSLILGPSFSNLTYCLIFFAYFVAAAVSWQRQRRRQSNGIRRRGKSH